MIIDSWKKLSTESRLVKEHCQSTLTTKQVEGGCERSLAYLLYNLIMCKYTPILEFEGSYVSSDVSTYSHTSDAENQSL
jgi:hypothetical protein